MKELFLEKFYYLKENAKKFNNLILTDKELDYLEEIFLSDKAILIFTLLKKGERNIHL